MPGINDKRVLHLAVALYRFPFDYPDLIRWLGGVYTYAHCDWNAVYDILHLVRDRPIPFGYPKVDIDHAMDLLRFGAPLEMHHSCTYQDLARREAYDNHPPIVDAIDEILRNFKQFFERGAIVLSIVASKIFMAFHQQLAHITY
jgi:hypothetical protein